MLKSNIRFSVNFLNSPGLGTEACTPPLNNFLFLGQITVNCLEPHKYKAMSLLLCFLQHLLSHCTGNFSLLLTNPQYNFLLTSQEIFKSWTIYSNISPRNLTLSNRQTMLWLPLPCSHFTEMQRLMPGKQNISPPLSFSIFPWKHISQTFFQEKVWERN